MSEVPLGMTTNTNSETIAREEKKRLAAAKGYDEPSPDDPKGMRQLFNVIAVIGKDTPDSHSLFSVMGNSFTVGGLRSLFPATKK